MQESTGRIDSLQNLLGEGIRMDDLIELSDEHASELRQIEPEKRVKTLKKMQKQEQQQRDKEYQAANEEPTGRIPRNKEFTKKYKMTRKKKNKLARKSRRKK